MCRWYNTTYSLTDDGHIIYILRSDSGLAVEDRDREVSPCSFVPTSLNIRTWQHTGTGTRFLFFFFLLTGCDKSQVKIFNREIIAAAQNNCLLPCWQLILMIFTKQRRGCYSHSHFAPRQAEFTKRSVILPIALASWAALNYLRRAIHIQPSADSSCNSIVSPVCPDLKPVSDNNGNEMLVFCFCWFFSCYFWVVLCRLWGIGRGNKWTVL